MNLKLAGQTLDQINFDFILQLSFSGGYGVQIESELRLETSNHRTAVRPGVGAPDHLTSLIGQAVSAALAEDTGALDLRFTEGAHLRVEPDNDFEAWNLFGPQGLKVVSLPGGGLSVWQPEQPAASPGPAST